MSRPILLVVDDDQQSLAAVAAALERRFGADYQVLTEASPAAALERLEYVCELGRPVAMVLAGVCTADANSLQWLARVQELCPRAARCALISYGDAPTYPVIRRALVAGQLETSLFKPIGDPEVQLYPMVSEILGAWARATRPRVPVLRIVGERWAHRSHELRDILERASVPYEFCAHDCDQGRQLLAEFGHAGALPAVIFRDRCLANPSDIEIATMLGVRRRPLSDVYDLVIVGA